MGRPTDLTPEVFAAIVQMIEGGVPQEVAAQAAGIGHSTFYEWIARGKGTAAPSRRNLPERAIYVDFAEAVEDARAQNEATNIQIIERAALTDWRAAAWYLERSRPQRYGRRWVDAGDAGLQVNTGTIEQMLSDPDTAEKVADASLNGTDTPLDGKPGGNGAAPEPG